MRRKLPLDPFDPATPMDPGYQLGKLSWAILSLALVGGGYLIASASYDERKGWLMAAAGVLAIIIGALIARKLFRSI